MKPKGDQAQAAELRERLRGLAPAQVVLMREMMRLHAAGERNLAAHRLAEVAQQAPDHPEVLLWQGLRHLEDSNWPQAVAVLTRAAAQRSADFKVWWMLGSAQAHVGALGTARQSLAHAAACARSASEWQKLSLEYDRHGCYEESLAAADELLRLQPASPVGLLQRSRCNKALGHAQAAAADCRRLIASGREIARTWFALVDLKTVALSDAERGQLEAAAARAGVTAADQPLLDFALGKVLEDAADWERALAAFARANAAIRASAPWHDSAFARRIKEIGQAFDGKPSTQAAAQGHEAIFIVGMPRSGSTLIDQVLAAHPDVEGASELPYLPQVIDAESRRRGRAFPAWVSQASAADWTRLGQQYLHLSARWREHKPIATDKLPDNWQYVGAIRAMLPEARIIDCRRDPLETCWSCYKQLFGPGMANFSYDFNSLAQYWAACEQLGDQWARQHPGHVRVQGYETLVAQPEVQIRELLAFCQLPFADSCLNFQAATRAIRTPSALQVRQPLHAASRLAAAYGALLDPLRAALELAQRAGRG